MSGRGDLSDVSIADAAGSRSESNAVGVALLDRDGLIVHANGAWNDFCRSAGGDLVIVGAGDSSLQVRAAVGDTGQADAVLAAIDAAVRGEAIDPVSIPIPCASKGISMVFDTLISSRFDAAGECIGATMMLSRIPVGEVPAPAVPPPGTNPRQPWAPDLLPALLRATELVAEEKALSQTLRRLAEAARELMGVSYAAVSISGSGGKIDEFAHAGIDRESLARLDSFSAIAAWLAGRPHFLSRDVALTGRRLATLYVAEGISDRFMPDVERLATSFVEAAGTAIENARAYQVSQRGHRWAEAAAELTQEVIAGAATGPLDLVLRHAVRAAEADLAGVLVPEDEERIRLVALVGGKPGVHEGRLFSRRGSPASDVMQSGQALLIESPTARIHEVSAEPMGPIAVVPLTSGVSVIGALVVSRRIDRARFDLSDLDALLRFTKYAGIALELDQALADRERLQVHDDRARIALELHDQVVRQLFAVGMGLEGIIEALHDVELRVRVAGYVAALDDSIRRIRETVYRMNED